MNKNIFNKLYFILAIILLVASMSSCSKNVDGAKLDLSYKMLADKTWYLDYLQTVTGTTVKTKTYIGQSTYFINFLSDNTTLDSDGISGTYKVVNVNGHLNIMVTAKTTGGNVVEYNYQVESLGAKVLVMSYLSGNTINKFFYSSK
jgi:hypothetical protein